MFQTMVSTPPDAFNDRRRPPRARAAPAARVVDLESTEHFLRLFAHRSDRARHPSDTLSALHLRVQVSPALSPEWRDDMLAELAGRLCVRLRGSDLVARWEITQFGVLLPRCRAAAAAAVLRRLIAAGVGSDRLGERPLPLILHGRLVTAETEGH